MSEASAGEGTTFYRYRDAQGRPVIVDSLSKVPSSARGTLENIALAPPDRSFSLPSAESLARELHWPSFITGALCALVLGGVLLGLRKRLNFALRGALVLGLVALATAAYFGWTRRMAGQSGALLASPEAVIQDARDAVQKMNERSREQERVLKELEAQH
jgi:hypothetical protein